MTAMASAELAGWAARYATSGLAVIPLHSIRDGACTCRWADCKSPGKHPLTRNGKDDATTDLTRVTAWWDRWSWANIGIRPPSGVIVLDVDPRNGGDTALERLTRQHGLLPRTLTARTGGGLHIWLVYAGRARGQLCPGVDVKTERGYVVAPPSLHASGSRYEWLWVLPPARAPRWVQCLLDPPPVPVHRSANTGGGNRDAGLVRTVAGAPEGSRNGVLYWAACRAHERGSAPALLAELLAAAMAAGLPESEARQTIASAARSSQVGVT